MRTQIIQRTGISYLLAYQGVRDFSFPENFEYVLNDLLRWLVSEEY